MLTSIAVQKQAFASALSLSFQVHSSIHEIPADQWNSCASPNNVFAQHDWLRCLEESQCASIQTGWVAQHIAVYYNDNNKNNDNDSNEDSNENCKNEDDLVAFVPMYVKGHSMGEFIFDQAFADAANRAGISYYPKLLIGIPFTPATGERILINPEFLKKNEGNKDVSKSKIRQGIASYLRQITIGNQLSSLHFNFLTESEATDIAGELDLTISDEYDLKQMIKSVTQKKFPFVRRTSVQYHWENVRPDENRERSNSTPYESFEDYLSFFKSKKRINIRRERKKVFEDEKIRVDAIYGKDILKYDGLLERMFEIYVSTIQKMYYGRQYLSLEFFQLLGKSDFIDNICFMCARDRSSGDMDSFSAKDVFAGTFNVVSPIDKVFYGRYWGCLSQMDHVKNLHFEVCYWKAIEYCIENGLTKMEPGAGGGDYKFARGFDPALIHSTHFFTNPGLDNAVRQFVDMERLNNIESTEFLKLNSRISKNATKN